MKKIIVKSPANIAFIKYWGRRDNTLILPQTDTFSMNLSDCVTTVELELFSDVTMQELHIKNYLEDKFVKTEGIPLEKVRRFYATVRNFVKTKKEFGFRIHSENSFPKKAGIASSASFFSALALTFSRAFEEKLPEKDLSILARLSGSGSAARSVPDGFVLWHKGDSSETSYAESIVAPDFWDLRDIVLIVNRDEKKTGSAEGHETALTSPLYEERLQGLQTRIPEMLAAFKQKDMTKFGPLLEAEALSMHSVMMSQVPPLYYWSEKTVSLLKKIIMVREQGLPVYFTIDAGENVHVICEGKDEQKAVAFFSKQDEVSSFIVNKPAVGARVITEE